MCVRRRGIQFSEQLESELAWEQSPLSLPTLLQKAHRSGRGGVSSSWTQPGKERWAKRGRCWPARLEVESLLSSDCLLEVDGIVYSHIHVFLIKYIFLFLKISIITEKATVSLNHSPTIPITLPKAIQFLGWVYKLLVLPSLCFLYELFYFFLFWVLFSMSCIYFSKSMEI